MLDDRARIEAEIELPGAYSEHKLGVLGFVPLLVSVFLSTWVVWDLPDLLACAGAILTFLTAEKIRRLIVASPAGFSPGVPSPDKTGTKGFSYLWLGLLVLYLQAYLPLYPLTYLLLVAAACFLIHVIQVNPDWALKGAAFLIPLVQLSKYFNLHHAATEMFVLCFLASGVDRRLERKSHLLLIFNALAALFVISATLGLLRNFNLSYAWGWILLFDAAVFLPFSDQVHPEFPLRSGLMWLIGIRFAIFVSRRIQSEESRSTLLRAFLWGAVPVVLFCLLQMVTGTGLSERAYLNDSPMRINGPFPDPNSFGSYLAAVVVLALGWTGKGIPRLLLAGLPALLLVMTGSRSGWLGAVVGLCFLFFRRLHGWKRWLLPASALTALACAAFLARMQGDTHYKEDSYARMLLSTLNISESNWRDVLKDRPSYWGAAFEMFKDYPVAGLGTGLYFREYSAYRRDPKTPRRENAHSQYLQLLAESGALTMALFMIAGVSTVVSSGRVSCALSAAVLAFLVTLLASHSMLVVSAAMAFWLLVGFALGNPAKGGWLVLRGIQRKWQRLLLLALIILFLPSAVERIIDSKELPIGIVKTEANGDLWIRNRVLIPFTRSSPTFSFELHGYAQNFPVRVGILLNNSLLERIHLAPNEVRRFELMEPVRQNDSILMIQIDPAEPLRSWWPSQSTPSFFGPVIAKLKLNDAELSSGGFYGEEVYPGMGKFRWTAQRAFWEVPEQASGVKMEIGATNPDLRRLPLVVELSLNAKTLSVLRFENAGWKKVQARVTEGFLTVKCSRSWSPAEYGDSRDDRELGVMIANLQWLP